MSGKEGPPNSQHRKRVAQILRYLADLHATKTPETRFFVRPCLGPPHHISNFFQQEDALASDEDEEGSTDESRSSSVLFTTEDFRRLYSATESNLPEPFTFYGVTANPDRKRTATGAQKNVSADPKTCWLRITRGSASSIGFFPGPPPAGPVRDYLQHWLSQTADVDVLSDLLTPRLLQLAPKVSPTSPPQDRQRIQTYLRRVKEYFKRKSRQERLESIYNRLFEYNANASHADTTELVWGLGHARHYQSGAGILVNGPLLEVLVEVELDPRDGALLVRPRPHTGVSLHKPVITALQSNQSPSNGASLARWHEAVSEWEATQVAPGQPTTYMSLLKRMAVELDSAGSFCLSHQAKPSVSNQTSSSLTVTEGWCLFGRPKPRSVWARDARAFADAVLRSDDFKLPQAAWALTHGPGALEEPTSSHHQASTSWFSWLWRGHTPSVAATPPSHHIFPLPASEAQNRIAHLLLTEQAPAVVCEGPPGTGKTHSIANIICAYLCQGKRVLVTSKNAPALSVLRQRLPAAVQELCVDVSASELTGMRQLAQTVERLADRVSCVNSEMERERCDYLSKTLDKLQLELDDLDRQLASQSAKSRGLLLSSEAQPWMELSLKLWREMPWLLKTITTWTPAEVETFRYRVEPLVLEEVEVLESVAGFEWPPSDSLIALAAARAGSPLSIISTKTADGIAALPVVGNLMGMKDRRDALKEALARLTLGGQPITSAGDWQIAVRALKHAKAMDVFEREIWNKCRACDGWPPLEKRNEQVRTLRDGLISACRLKEVAFKLDVTSVVEACKEYRSLDNRRCVIAEQIQKVSQDLVATIVVTQLSQSFSAEAQSALVRFSQIAGKSKFGRQTQPSKMTQRQKRRRQEYLDAFDRCVRFIPSWILTTSQISDYLPSECLFDLVVIDEASQSGPTVIPGMLRGKQWLIVGDNKQTSPTEIFVAETEIENLRSALPSTPLRECLLPGQSFFDMCSQAFPKGRVVLSEHFRCAEEIIAFSNDQFYNGRLVPLRLPTKGERIVPSIVDVMLADGKKVDKVNPLEVDEIVRRIQDLVIQQRQQQPGSSPRSIGVISLLGDEQSRLIRGRLLDSIGPQLMARHDVLVGDPPTFQGAERDIVFLSMVCSTGSVPTQNQFFHYQRANVALSRARDQMILVRSIHLGEIPSYDDVKVPIIEFFQSAAAQAGATATQENDAIGTSTSWQDPLPGAKKLLEERLQELGFSTRPMGVVWQSALSVEDPQQGDVRAGILVDSSSHQETWLASYKQQRAIERVGWKTMRISAPLLLADPHGTIDSILDFLAKVGIQPMILYDELEDEDMEEVPEEPAEAVADNNVLEEQQEQVAPEEQPQPDPDPVVEAHGAAVDAVVVPAAADDDGSAIVISSDDDDNDYDNGKPAAQPDYARSQPGLLERAAAVERLDAGQFGQVVHPRDFLRANDDNDEDDALSSSAAAENMSASRGVAGRVNVQKGNHDLEESNDDDDDDPIAHARRSKRRRRMDAYQRDGRWYPGHAGELKDDDDDDSSYQAENMDVLL